MKLFKVAVVVGVLGAAPAMFGDVIDYMLNDNTVTYCPTGTFVAGCNNTTGLTDPNITSNTLDTSFDAGGQNSPSPYGLGSVSLTINGGAVPANYTVGLWLFEELVPDSGYDEYGAVSSAPLPSGESYQIDTPDYDYSNADPNSSATGTIIANTKNGTLSNSNDVPGQTDSINGGANGLCLTSSDPSCNDYTSMSLMDKFGLLGNGDSETLTFTVSQTAPSGFYLEQFDPGETGTSANYYYSLAATYNPAAPSSGVPEPSYFLPLVLLVGITWLVARRRSAAV